MPGVGLRRRVLFIFLVTALAFLGLSVRLAYVQLVRGNELRAEARENRLWEVPVQPRRGAIVDRNGHELAISVNADSVYAVPTEISDPEATARRLAEILGLPYVDLYERLTRPASFSWVQRKVTDDVADQIRALDLPGIYFTQESRRVYPKGELAAHVLGIAGIDNQGLEGIELVYDEVLAGVQGWIKVEFDARGREIPFAVQHYVEPQDGLTLELTLDETIQYIAERELDRAMLAHQAEAGYILVMDPRTGELLAMAVRPTFDPNRFAEYSADIRRNRAVSDTFPPGSAFKPVTAAAAIEEGVVTPETGFYDPGYFRVPGHTIHNWNRQGLGATTFAEGFQESANTIFARVAVDLGVEPFYRYLDAFGLTTRTGIDLPGEASGIFPPAGRARPVDIAVMGFCQTLTVTPIQMITAISAIANDGLLMKPRVARAVRDADGKVVRVFEPEPVRQVISEQTARTIRGLMERVVAEGTGTQAQIEGYGVGGKTGTSQKVIGGRLAPGRYISSFIGMVPIDDPQLVVYVVIDEPKGIYYGSWVAAPVFARVARDVLHYLQVPATEQNEVEPEGPPRYPAVVPNVVNLTVAEAVEVLRYAGFSAQVQGEGTQVTAQFPNAGVRITAGATVVLAAGGEIQGAERQEVVTVPDLTGLDRRAAAERLAQVGLRLDPHGEGEAHAQDPAAGQRVPQGTFVRVEFQPPEGAPAEPENGSQTGP
ncbi:MAG TPA: penicillin-binding transpeptidase domain-containing protein [Bacillota bacterium]